jgi:hypothetical protein
MSEDVLEMLRMVLPEICGVGEGETREFWIVEFLCKRGYKFR